MTSDDREAAAAAWERHMRRAEFAAAWAISDRLLVSRDLFASSSTPRHLQQVWDGSAIDGRRLLVRCYHGLGDTIQFIRFAPLLRARCSEVIVWAQRRLLRLLSTVKGIDRLLPLHDGLPGVEYDVDIEIMEAPFVLRTTLDAIPDRVPYVHPRVGHGVSHLPCSAGRGSTVPSTAPTAAGVLPDRPNVGLAWRAGDWAPGRSIPFAQLSALTESHVSWYVLQGEPGIGECPPDFGHVAGTRSIDDAAAIVANLDLVITVDSMPAHLAGALGTPVWTLLQRHADWRWMEGRADSPWYPTMRLFRQQQSGDWGPVIAEVATALGNHFAGGKMVR